MFSPVSEDMLMVLYGLSCYVYMSNYCTTTGVCPSHYCFTCQPAKEIRSEKTLKQVLDVVLGSAMVLE